MYLRIAEPADGDALAAIYAPIVLETAISFEEIPPDGAEMARRVAACLTHKPWIVAIENGAVAGYAYGRPHGDRAAYRWSADTGIYVADWARGRGVGRRLYGALVPMLRWLGYRSLFAGVTLPNAASVGLHEAVGFTACGVEQEAGYKFGGWHDVGRWRLGLCTDTAAPVEPRVFDQVRTAPQVQALLGEVR